jgi:hypothetical protein
MGSGLIMPDYIDILITDDDVTLDSGGEPQLIVDADCITQDIKHLIRDSGLMVEIIGQRNEIVVRSNLQKLELMIEDDERLVPGTITITQTDVETFFVTATTYKYGVIQLQVNS